MMRSIRSILGFALGLLSLVVAFGTTSAAQPADWKAEWERTVAAANKEGQLVISAPSGYIWREQLMTFQKAYPAIKLDLAAAASRDFWPRIIKEREAGQSLWDFRVGGPDNLVYSVKSMGYMTSVRDMLILPEVLDDNAWYGGLDGIFLDKEKTYFLGFAIYEENIAYYNKKVVSDPAMANLKNIVDPKWSGKISMADPRAGSPLTASGSMLKAYGEDFLRKLVVQQKPIIVRDPRQQMEWLASGRYPISIGVPTAALVEYEKRGADITDYVNMAGPRTWTQGVGGIQALKDAPHPNATKVFVNWLLTRDIQKQIMTAVKINSRRKDVPIADPESAIDYAKLDEYVGGQTEVMQPFQKRASDIYRELLKQ